jgi:hypothetical protein
VVTEKREGSIRSVAIPNPMKTIFECETELGKCDDHLVADPGNYNSTEPWTIYALTTACVNGSKHMLKIEQRCYLRRGPDLTDQPWIRSDMILEPIVGSQSDAATMVQALHQTFIRKAREQLPEHVLEPGPWQVAGQ